MVEDLAGVFSEAVRRISDGSEDSVLSYPRRSFDEVESECVIRVEDGEEGGTMLRFFSRRKAKGRAEQKVITPGRKPVSKPSKYVISCNIILLDGSDLPLEIGVSNFISLRPRPVSEFE